MGVWYKYNRAVVEQRKKRWIHVEWDASPQSGVGGPPLASGVGGEALELSTGSRRIWPGELLELSCCQKSQIPGRLARDLRLIIRSFRTTLSADHMI
jgi:hypothetical protein